MQAASNSSNAQPPAAVKVEAPKRISRLENLRRHMANPSPRLAAMMLAADKQKLQDEPKAE